MTLSLIVLAELFFNVLYRDAYQAAAYLTPLLAGMFWISIVQETVIRTSLAMGSFSVPAYTNMVAFVARMTLAFIGFKLDGGSGYGSPLSDTDIAEKQAHHLYV